MVNEFLKQANEREIAGCVKNLVIVLERNETKPKEEKADTLTFAVEKDGRFIAVNGSAHEMKELFLEFFDKRPEFRFVVQNALDSMYFINDK